MTTAAGWSVNADLLIWDVHSSGCALPPHGRDFIINQFLIYVNVERQMVSQPAVHPGRYHGGYHGGTLQYFIAFSENAWVYFSFCTKVGVIRSCPYHRRFRLTCAPIQIAITDSKSKSNCIALWKKSCLHKKWTCNHWSWYSKIIVV